MQQKLNRTGFSNLGGVYRLRKSTDSGESPQEDLNVEVCQKFITESFTLGKLRGG